VPDYVILTPLGDLRWHWGGAYRITAYPRCWRAQRRDDGRDLFADDSEQLRALIRTDYTRQPVPREGCRYA
jgi:hypothetical protein